MKKVLLVSMEAAFSNAVKTYAGGLGILVGDKLRASQDLGLGITVLTFS
ncbi:MAG: glycosyltransferase family 1 protein, partial [Candidatus Altiarchaeota archaeon]|nr:glycosyltransferase family 1 protein [Candidatus Altiarchaeota archaeon]